MSTPVKSEGSAQWRVRTVVEKYEGVTDAAFADAQRGRAIEPTRVDTFDSNLLMYGGASVLFEALLGNSTATAGQALTVFNNANAAIGVGDSTTAAAATQTDLQATPNQARRGMEATYPLHTDANDAAAATITFRAVFQNAEANWAWNEWAIFNSPAAATGRMLNRKVESMGTKTDSAIWTITCSITLA